MEPLADGYYDAMALGGTLYAPKVGRKMGKSTDGGMTWTDSAYTFPHDLQSVFPTKDGTLLACASGRVFRSADDGANWTEVLQTVHTPYSYITTRAWAQAPGGAIFAGEYGEDNGNLYLWRSVDDGQNWTRLDYFLDKDARHLHSVFVDPETSRLYVTTGDTNKRTYYSDDSGGTWTQIFSGQTTGFTAITSTATARYFADDLAPGSNRVWKSTNDTALVLSYTPQTPTYDTQPGGIVAVDGTTDLWYTSGNEPQTTQRATVARSADGGATWALVAESAAGGYQFRMPAHDWRGRIPAEMPYFVCTAVPNQQMIRINRSGF